MVSINAPPSKSNLETVSRDLLTLFFSEAAVEVKLKSYLDVGIVTKLLGIVRSSAEVTVLTLLITS